MFVGIGVQRLAAEKNRRGNSAERNHSRDAARNAANQIRSGRKEPGDNGSGGWGGEAVIADTEGLISPEIAKSIGINHSKSDRTGSLTSRPAGTWSTLAEQKQEQSEHPEAGLCGVGESFGRSELPLWRQQDGTASRLPAGPLRAGALISRQMAGQAITHKARPTVNVRATSIELLLLYYIGSDRSASRKSMPGTRIWR